jgi:RHS repeat-associated protein
MAALDASNGCLPSRSALSGAAGSGVVTTTYTYDTENRLTGLASGGNTIGLYAYDGAGNRVGKTAAGLSTAYSLDLASGLPQVLTETTGSAVSSYAYAGGPLELDRSGTTYWYLSDTLGSVRLVTDSVGASPATYAYSAFGSTRTSTGTLANEVRFSGERTDTESGLEFLRARTYDPSVGTFLQRDTWGITPTNSQSLDAYAYTENDPTDRVDPSGHSARVYDEGPVHHGLLQASTAYAVPIKAQSAAQRGDVLSGASDTSAQRQLQRTLAKKAASTPQADSCGFGPACVLTGALGTAGDEVRAAGPALAVLGGAAASCAVGVFTVLSAPVLCAPAAGITAYTLVNAATKLGKWPLEGWNTADAAASGGAGLLMALLPETTGPGTLLTLGFLTGVGLDVIAQKVQDRDKPINWNHAVCAGGGGALGAIPVLGRELKGFAYNVVQGVAGTQACAGH